MQVVVDELVTNYQRTGSGKTILLVHGWANSLSSFYDLQQYLAKDYEVISVDLPGFGQSSQPPIGWSLDDYAKFLNHFLAKLKVKTYAVVGHSNGGGILITGLANKTLAADKLILLSSAGVRNQEKIKQKTVKAVAKSGKVISSVLPGTIRESVRKKFYGAIGSEIFIAPNMEETFRLVVGQDVQTAATKVNAPTLLIYGEGDKSTPPSHGEILASKIPNSELRVLENAEHFVHIDQPLQVGSLVKDFLND